MLQLFRADGKKIFETSKDDTTQHLKFLGKIELNGRKNGEHYDSNLQYGTPFWVSNGGVNFPFMVTISMDGGG